MHSLMLDDGIDELELLDFGDVTASFALKLHPIDQYTSMMLCSLLKDVQAKGMIF